MASSDCEFEHHIRTIIHIDIDCFYAQVEMLKRPELQTKPVGIQQKNIVVTCNYPARKFGITKCMLLAEAKSLCPDLILVNGEDLHDYRQMSAKILTVLQKITNHIEKLGLDENFIDVTQIVANRSVKFDQSNAIEGYVYSTNDTLNECICGCHRRLKIGAAIAKELRDALRNELGITSCAGISHNKLLAKLVGSCNKPNQQTTLSPDSMGELLTSLGNVKAIPGIGVKTAEVLNSLGVNTISELQDCNPKDLQKTFGFDTAKKLKDLSLGRDDSLVKISGKPLTVGLEDSCKAINVKSEVEEKFKVLLKRLMELQIEDGRVPLAVKVTIRKHDVKKISHRETKQANLPPSFFMNTDRGITLAAGALDKLLQIVMKLFHRIIDISKPFHVTLLGLAFTKFQERKSGRSSIASFLIKNISVQSVTSFENYSGIRESPPSPMELSGSGSEIQTDNSDNEVEPSPKKAKLGFLIARRRCFNQNDVASPSKLKVSELRLNSKELDRSCEDLECPPDIDPHVFKELPSDVQKELIDAWKKAPSTNIQSTINKSKQNNITRYFITNK